MIKTITYITTADSKKTYEYPPKDGIKNPDILKVLLKMDWVDSRGNANPDSVYKSTSGIAYLERETMENAGIIPFKENSSVKVPVETAEDLIIRLLEMVQVYPNE